MDQPGDCVYTDYRVAISELLCHSPLGDYDLTRGGGLTPLHSRTRFMVTQIASWPPSLCFTQDSLHGKDADFDCMPMNMDVLDAAGASAELQGGGYLNSSSSCFASAYNARRTADCKNWNPDMPELLGLYHAYVRGYNKDTRCASVVNLFCFSQDRHPHALFSHFAYIHAKHAHAHIHTGATSSSSSRVGVAAT